MAKKKSQKRPKPLIPRFKRHSQLGGMGVVTMRIPPDTPEAEIRAARRHQINMAKKICLQHEKDHWFEKGWTD
jgi:hypothetical protein